MSDLSRRNFLKHLTDAFSDSVASESLKRILLKDSNGSSWLRLTSISEMAPGRALPFEFEKVRGVLYSNEYGLYALLESGRYAALRTTPHGLIEVNVNDKWSRGQLLSHVTGAAVFLNKGGNDG